MRALLHSPAYVRLVVSQGVRQVGVFAAQLLLAASAWYEHSPLAAGGVALAASLPSILAPWLIATRSDQHGRRWWYLAILLAELVVTAGCALALLGSSPVAVLALLALALGLTNACHYPLFLTATVDVVEEDLRERAAVGVGYSYDGGKLLGGGVVALALLLGAPGAALGLSVIAAAWALWWVRDAVPAAALPRAERLRDRSPLPWPSLRAPLLAMTVMSCITTQIPLVLIALGAEGREAAGAGLGWRGAVFSAGAILGTYALSRHERLSARLLAWCPLALGGVLIAAGLLDLSTALGLLAVTGYGFALGYTYQGLFAVMLPRVEASVRGRLAGLTALLTGSSGALGAIAFGGIAEQQGPGAALVVCGVGSIAAGLLLCAGTQQQGLREGGPADVEEVLSSRG